MFLTLDYVDTLLANVIRDSVAFLPELILCVTIVLMLVLRLFNAVNRFHMGWLALACSVAALAVSAFQWTGAFGFTTPAMFLEKAGKPDIYAGLLVYDNLTLFLRMFLFGFAALVVWLSLVTGIPDRDDSADFYCLLLGATLGMAMMASSNHLLMVFISVEMASVPSYVLAGFLKGRRASSEAALKYVVYGGGAAGIMLYGISLIAGKFGTGYVPDVAAAYAATIAAHGQLDWVLVLGTMFILVGIGFKLAAVPFHFWCPDVFEGASAEVAGFLSVASKGAAIALLGRLVLMLARLDQAAVDPETWQSVVSILAPILAVFAAITATFGNLAAYLQTNLKRLLAYSTIAHAGYMLMGLATLRADGMAAVLIYLVAYLFMNQGAFAIVAFLRNQTKSEDLSSFAGLVRRSPWMVVTLAFCLLSLLGVPPLVGFVAKFQIFRVLYDAGWQYYSWAPWLGWTMFALLLIGGINSVFSLFYYVKVLKVMILDRPPDEEVESKPLDEPLGMRAYAGAMAAALVILFVAWGPLSTASSQGVARFHDVKATPTPAVAKEGK